MLERFQLAAEAVGATVERFPSREQAAAYVRVLAGDGTVVTSALPAAIHALLADLPRAKELEMADAGLGVSVARAGIAATGSLLLELTDPAERSATALPPVHAVFLDAAAIVSDLRAVQGLLAETLAGAPNAYLSLTTGPSRTADIERVLTIGVHGPKELHILIVDQT